MAETMARISAEGRVELIDSLSAPIESVAPMTPLDAAYLARGVLACAAALSSAYPPAAGAIVGDADLLINRWVVSTNRVTGKPVLIFSIQPGIELIFELTPQGAEELGAALMARGRGPNLGEVRGTVH